MLLVYIEGATNKRHSYPNKFTYSAGELSPSSFGSVTAIDTLALPEDGRFNPTPDFLDTRLSPSTFCAELLRLPSFNWTDEPRLTPCSFVLTLFLCSCDGRPCAIAPSCGSPCGAGPSVDIRPFDVRPSCSVGASCDARFSTVPVEGLPVTDVLSPTDVDGLTVADALAPVVDTRAVDGLSPV